jgi:hypothetical protein
LDRPRSTIDSIARHRFFEDRMIASYGGTIGSQRMHEPNLMRGGNPLMRIRGKEMRRDDLFWRSRVRTMKDIGREDAAAGHRSPQTPGVVHPTPPSKSVQLFGTSAPHVKITIPDAQSQESSCAQLGGIGQQANAVVGSGTQQSLLKVVPLGHELPGPGSLQMPANVVFATHISVDSHAEQAATARPD